MSDKLVYSTEFGDMCSGCQQPKKECRCHVLAKSAVVPTDGICRVRFETKGRKGKGVTLVTGLPLSENDLEKVAKDLKHRLGTGGTVKDKHIEIQGDRVEEILGQLQKQGFKVKRG